MSVTEEHLEILRRLFVAVVAQRPSVERDRSDPDYIMINGGRLSICPTEVAIESFAGKTLVPGWLLSLATYHNNYPHSPDDVDVEEIASDCVFLNIARRAVEIHVAQVLENAIEVIAMDHVMADIGLADADVSESEN